MRFATLLTICLLLLVTIQSTQALVRRVNWRDGPKTKIPEFKGDPTNPEDFKIYLTDLQKFNRSGITRFVQSYWNHYHLLPSDGLTHAKFARMLRQVARRLGSWEPTTVEIDMAFDIIDVDKNGTLEQKELIKAVRGFVEETIKDVKEYIDTLKIAEKAGDF